MRKSQTLIAAAFVLLLVTLSSKSASCAVKERDTIEDVKVATQDAAQVAADKAHAAQAGTEGVWEKIKSTVVGSSHEAAKQAGQVQDAAAQKAAAASGAAKETAAEAGAATEGVWQKIKQTVTGAKHTAEETVCHVGSSNVCCLAERSSSALLMHSIIDCVERCDHGHCGGLQLMSRL
jgi:hypothetical protein